MFEKEIWNWFSLHWFLPSTLREFQWENRFFLLIIPAIPVLFILRWLFYFPIKQKFDIAFFGSEVKKMNWVQFLRLIPHSVQMLCIILAIVAIARPQSVNERIDQWTEGIEILLVMDISESMQIEDFKPNRLEAAKDVAKKFINGRNQDRIGVVVFAGDAYSLSPLTNDYQMLYTYLNDINFNMIENSGTAIGDALGVGINRMNESSNASKIMILLSDGENTGGILDPVTAAKLAYAYNIKIYSIGIGKEGDVVFGKDSSGHDQYVKSHLDETTLRRIADITKGNYFRAVNNNTLSEIFLNINKLERGKIKETRYKDTKDYYYIYLTWSIVLLLLWLVLKSTFLNNFLED